MKYLLCLFILPACAEIPKAQVFPPLSDDQCAQVVKNETLAGAFTASPTVILASTEFAVTADCQTKIDQAKSRALPREVPK